MLDYFVEFFSFFEVVLIKVFDFILSNRVIFDFFFLSIAIACIYIVIDFVFDIRNDAAEFNRFKEEGYIRYKFRSKKSKKQKQLDMNEVYRKSKENADYKHSLKMKEMEAFRKNEDNRHAHRHEEHSWYSNNLVKNNPSQKINSANSSPVSNKKVNLDIEVED